MQETTKFDFIQYKEYCKTHNIKPSQWTSLAKYAKIERIRREVQLINRHSKKLKQLCDTAEIDVITRGV